jgi:hypothetical protein
MHYVIFEYNPKIDWQHTTVFNPQELQSFSDGEIPIPNNNYHQKLLEFTKSLKSSSYDEYVYLIFMKQDLNVNKQYGVTYGKTGDLNMINDGTIDQSGCFVWTERIKKNRDDSIDNGYNAPPLNKWIFKTTIHEIGHCLSAGHEVDGAAWPYNVLPYQKGGPYIPIDEKIDGAGDTLNTYNDMMSTPPPNPPWVQYDNALIGGINIDKDYGAYTIDNDGAWGWSFWSRDCVEQFDLQYKVSVETDELWGLFSYTKDPLVVLLRSRGQI